MRSIYDKSEYEFIEKKSRFIGIMYHVRDIETIESKLDEIKKIYPGANHYVYAYKLDDHTQKASDDGEPQRTAGYPVLDVLNKNKLNDVLAIVIRYFGGIKLGAGGLIRAYSTTIAETLKKATFIEKVTSYYCQLQTSYNHLGDIEKIVREQCKLDKVDYKEKITFYFYLYNDQFEKVKDTLFHHNGYEDHLKVIEKKLVYAKVSG
ncbi:YigZ family protein [Mycoplasmatota bacterium]|nr:YigZ family protein [Mycoplasmatota bacterium]